MSLKAVQETHMREMVRIHEMWQQTKREKRQVELELGHARHRLEELRTQAREKEQRLATQLATVEEQLASAKSEVLTLRQQLEDAEVDVARASRLGRGVGRAAEAGAAATSHWQGSEPGRGYYDDVSGVAARTGGDGRKLADSGPPAPRALGGMDHGVDVDRSRRMRATHPLHPRASPDGYPDPLDEDWENAEDAVFVEDHARSYDADAPLSFSELGGVASHSTVQPHYELFQDDSFAAQLEAESKQQQSLISRQARALRDALEENHALQDALRAERDQQAKLARRMEQVKQDCLDLTAVVQTNMSPQKNHHEEKGSPMSRQVQVLPIWSGDNKSKGKSKSKSKNKNKRKSKNKSQGVSRHRDHEEMQEQQEEWLPRAVSDLMSLYQREVRHPDDIRESLSNLLNELNTLWRQETRQEIGRLRKIHSRKLKDIKRRFADRIPYAQVRQRAEIVRLRNNLQRLRASRVHTVEHSDAFVRLALATIENLSKQLLSTQEQVANLQALTADDLLDDFDDH